MKDNSPWSPRARAAVVTSGEHLYLLGRELGFLCDPLPDCDLPYPNNVRVSAAGPVWEQLTNQPWNARFPKDIKYDFDITVTDPYDLDATPVI